jgi:hypothetical protein
MIRSGIDRKGCAYSDGTWIGGSCPTTAFSRRAWDMSMFVCDAEYCATVSALDSNSFAALHPESKKYRTMIRALPTCCRPVRRHPIYLQRHQLPLDLSTSEGVPSLPLERASFIFCQQVRSASPASWRIESVCDSMLRAACASEFSRSATCARCSNSSSCGNSVRRKQKDVTGK